MPITRSPMVDDDGSGTTGTIINNAWKQELYGQIDAYVPGSLVNVPFAAANYTAGAGVWTVTAANQIVLAYAVGVNLVTLFFTIGGAGQSLTVAGATLFVTVPGIPVPIRTVQAPIAYFANGPAGTGMVDNTNAGAKFTFIRDLLGTAWPVVANGNIQVNGQLTYPYR